MDRLYIFGYDEQIWLRLYDLKLLYYPKNQLLLIFTKKYWKPIIRYLYLNLSSLVCFIPSHYIMKTIIWFLVVWAIVALASYVLPGVEVDWFLWAVWVGVVLALLSSTVWALLRVLSLPLNILSFGLVGGLISVGLVLLASNVLSGFEVWWFWNAVIFAIIVGVLTSLFGVD